MLNTLKFSRGLFLITLFLLKSLPLFSGTEVPLPASLHEIPFADQQGIILSVKDVPIHPIEAPYNAALIKSENDNYLLVFRYDIKIRGFPKYNYIACVELDEKLEQKRDFKNINTS